MAVTAPKSRATRTAGIGQPGRSQRADAHELLLIPPDLRTTDPSLFAELSAGTMGLAGATVALGEGSPFDATPPNSEWHAALLGFAWLSDLRAANLPDANALARLTIEAWLASDPAPDAPDWHPATAARRLISWLSNAAILIEPGSAGTPAGAHQRFLADCDWHMRQLTEMLTRGRTRAPITVAIALTMGCLCLAGQEQRKVAALARLREELARQILPDGGHVSRHPGAPVELLLDLLPLRQCFMARKQKPPPWLTEALQQMIPALRLLQLGDRGLARFNGMMPGGIDQLMTVLSYNAGGPAINRPGTANGYLRLVRGSTIVIADCGPTPPLEHSGQAHAGTLSFEMSSGPHLIIVNAGAPGPAARAWRRQARGTPAHSTVLLNDTSSARLIKPAAVDGPELLAGPNATEARIIDLGDGSAEIQASHNGYQPAFNLIHERVLRLSADGGALQGLDRIHQPKRGVAANRGNLTYAVHFHIHPQAQLRYGAEPGTAEIELRSGEIWVFGAYGSKLGLEDSSYFASFAGPTRSMQIVLRGLLLADTQIRWLLERRVPMPQPQLAAALDDGLI